MVAMVENPADEKVRKSNIERRDSFVSAFQKNFYVEKKLTKAQEKKLMEIKMKREQADYDPLKLHEQAVKADKERKVLRRDFGNHFAKLSEKEKEQKYGVDIFTAYHRSSQAGATQEDKKKYLDHELDFKTQRLHRESLRQSLATRSLLNLHQNDGWRGNLELSKMRMERSKIHVPTYQVSNERGSIIGVSNSSQMSSSGGSPTEVRKSQSVQELRDAMIKSTYAMESLDEEEEEETDDNLKIIYRFAQFIVEKQFSFDDLFKWIDTNRSGDISRYEFMDGMGRLRYPEYRKSDLEYVWTVLDINKSGGIDYDEYKNLKPYYDRVMAKEEKKKRMMDSWGVDPTLLQSRSRKSMSTRNTGGKGSTRLPPL